MRWMLSRPSALLTHKHRWLRFSLKGFLIVITVFCVWLGMRANDVRRQQRAVAMVNRLGGLVEYDYSHEAMLRPDVRLRKALASMQGGPPFVIEPPGPQWLRSLVGDEYFVKLHRIDLIDTPVTDSDLLLLEGQKGLWCLRLWETEVTDKGLHHIRGLRNLRILDLRSANVTDAGLRHFGELKRLEGLGLGSSKIGDAGLVQIEKLAGLGSLTLSHTRVTDAGISRLRACTELWSLNLAGTQVTDAGLVHLAGLLKLQKLELNDTQVTDSGLAHLRGLTKLTFLNLNDTQVTEAGVQELFKALPQISEIRRGPVRNARR